ncbi:MAG: hypothetical protein ACRDY6_16400 [Acidimicrobiia bacterium]
MPVKVEPPELARLLDFAERPRVDDWSLRAALVRYAQPEPERAARLLELVRRAEGALHRHGKLLERDGPAIWATVTDDPSSPTASHPDVTALLLATAELDQLGDRLATWAVDRAGNRPDTEVDEVVADVAHRLDALGIPRDERDGPPRRRR